MSCTMKYYAFLPGYNDGIFENPGTVSVDTLTAVYDYLIAKRLPPCLIWCGNEIIGPYNPDGEEQKQLDEFPGFEEIQEEAWNEFISLSDEDILKLYEEI